MSRVSFAEEATFYPSDRTPSETKQSWYTKSELSNFKNERKELVRFLKRIDFDLEKIDQTKCSLRGYEPYFSIQMNQATRCARELVFTIVFAEQNRQRVLGIKDDESMRACSCRASHWARCNAFELGQMDAAEMSIVSNDECEHLVSELTGGNQDKGNNSRPKMLNVTHQVVEQLQEALNWIETYDKSFERC